MHWTAPLQQRLLKLFVKPSIVGESPLNTAPHTYYVLEYKRSSQPLVLRNLLPSLTEDQLLFADSGGEQPLGEDLYSLLKAQRSNTDIKIRLVPVSVFYGHLPHREKSLLRTLFGESWAKGNPLTRALRILLNGRNTLISVDKPVLLNELDDLPLEEASRKLTRVLRTHFQISRRTVIGPDLSHRRTLLGQVMQHKEVQAALDQSSGKNGGNRFAAEQQSRQILDIIAADFSPNIARILNSIVTAATRRLYPGGVHLRNAEQLHSLSKSHQLIYLPCHRSHMDYIMLSWALYQHGLMLPHVAAGDNLNLPVIGPILKRGGAIFMRRSFQGDKLYYSLYKAYLEALSHHGHAIEYFIEGGRSRTGRLLHPRTGLLRMTVESFRTTPNVPLAIVPVWIGYDRLIEGASYQAELSGAAKNQESLGNSLMSLGILGKRFGSVHLNIGKPLLLAEQDDPEKSVFEQARLLGRQTLKEVNRVASALPISLLATCLLSQPSRRMASDQLLTRSQQLLDVLRRLPKVNLSLPETAPHAWLDEAVRHQLVSRRENVICVSEEQAQNLTFYRNMISHLVALPGLYLLAARRLGGCRSQTISRLIGQLYPTLDAELTLPWQPEELTLVLRDIRDSLTETGLLIQSEQRVCATESVICQLLQLSTEPMLLRYYLVLRVVDRYQQINQNDLLSQSSRLAKQIHHSYGFQSREYADKRVFSSFIEQALSNGLLRETKGRLMLGEDPQPVFKLARRILRPHLIVTVDQKLGSAG
ncbi:1-acyl-sn-glycerol-3-phosphate acyltransferase [Pontibacterium granulatum]|uniref:1-acyl-sn-glycerol-3-phosphate acyltransferase n=1 Tax=Pontibacterium granulatum TaxID=2036029 RepID=UPI00249CC14C|nr:1-acyl-sn-glycerol-3-phosphate acyltransferase [Pontibacterium granulatum]MDI3323176.1 1-acyl-sn-glycerol-3-phosphate acyltransferase [Pontibacterium granulatum]